MVTGDGLSSSSSNNNSNTSVILDDFLYWILNISEKTVNKEHSSTGSSGSGTGSSDKIDTNTQSINTNNTTNTMHTVSNFLNHPDSQVPYSILTYDSLYININNICLVVFDEFLSADVTIGLMMLQHIVAPPPPPPSDEDMEVSMGSMGSSSGTGSKIDQDNAFKPLGLLLINTVVGHICSILVDAGVWETGTGDQTGTQGQSEGDDGSDSGSTDTNTANINILAAMQKQNQIQVNANLNTHTSNTSNTSPKYSERVAFALRAVNILTMVFVRGDDITAELGNRINVSHTCLDSMPNTNTDPNTNTNRNTALFSYILGVLIPKLLLVVESHPLVSALFRLLSSSIHGCVNGVKTLLETPGIGYIYELLSPASDYNGGISQSIQASVALFLGSCIATLPLPVPLPIPVSSPSTICVLHDNIH